MPTTTLLVVVFSGAVLFAGPQVTAPIPGDSLREALVLGKTHDDALFEAFNKSYELTPSGTIDRAEIITEFRRAVLLVRERALAGDYAFNEAGLTKALVPYKGLVAFVAQARVHPQNAFVREPPYDLYVSSGPRSPPVPPKSLKRDPINVPGPMGSPLVAVRLEASFPRADIDAAPAPELIVTDEKADVIWRARIDLSRYR